ncbi:hypothetical protein, partial [Hyalangium gracile]|uniref:hypothetical protein n=1 Tax=Hyalangium gracile TaxID=394092 RepID=UPI001CCB0F6B
MARLLPLALLVLLSVPLMGGNCGESEAVPLEELQRDVPPAFDYALYCDAHGKLVGQRSAVLLVYRAEHLERVYADAQAGDSRARTLFRQLEDSLLLTGRKLAHESLG